VPQAFDSAADDPREVRLRFDFADASGGQDARLFSRPAQIIVARIPAEVPAAMAAVEDGLRRGYHAAGFVAYEAAPGFDTALTTKPPSIVPLVWFGLFDAPQVVARLGDGGVDAAEQPAAETPWTPDISPDAYSAGIATVRDAIAEGESYQTNYTFRLRAAMTADGAEALYRRLAIDQRAPYAAYLEIGRWRILSLSPELFFRIDRNLITTRPMKGTAARGTSADDDARQAAGLRASEKNRAENVMIVDLARNDVGRIAEVGSVRVTHLFDIERYPSVFQMVSTVEGRFVERPGPVAEHLGDHRERRGRHGPGVCEPLDSRAVRHLRAATDGIGDEHRVVTVLQSLHRRERQADLGVQPADDEALTSGRLHRPFGGRSGLLGSPACGAEA